MHIMHLQYSTVSVLVSVFWIYIAVLHAILHFLSKTFYYPYSIIILSFRSKFLFSTRHWFTVAQGGPPCGLKEGDSDGTLLYEYWCVFCVVVFVTPACSVRYATLFIRFYKNSLFSCMYCTSKHLILCWVL